MEPVSQIKQTKKFLSLSMTRSRTLAKRQAAGLATVPALLFYYSGQFFLTSRFEVAILQDLCELDVFRSFSMTLVSLFWHEKIQIDLDT
jgi:hypothetical protein